MKIVRLSKNSNLNRIDKVFNWHRFSGRGPQGEGVPAGGSAGEVLAKVNGDDFNTEWVPQSGGGGGNSRDDHGEVVTTEEISGNFNQHTMSADANLILTFADFSETQPRFTCQLTITVDGTTVTPTTWIEADDSINSLAVMAAGIYELKGETYDNGVSGSLFVSLINLLITGSLTEPIGISDPINVLFSETSDPATVTNTGSGATGSFRLYNNTTGPAWVDCNDIVTTTDNLTFTITPASDLTEGDNYTVFLEDTILNAANDRSYSGTDFSFTAAGTIIISDGSIVDDACDTLPGIWTDGSTGNGAIGTTIFDTATVINLNTNANHVSDSQGRLDKTITPPTSSYFVVTFRVYPVKLGSVSNVEGFQFVLAITATTQLVAYFSDLGLYSFNNVSSLVEVGTNVNHTPNPTGSWQEWTFECSDFDTVAPKFDLYKRIGDLSGNPSSILVASNVEARYKGSGGLTPGLLFIQTNQSPGSAESDLEANLDYVKIGNGVA